ncbi:MAG: hypothetical protein OXU20_10115 [Myxococcales bacterium]|nr:hypothetical protein [Myxococcales bacterium]
MGHVTHEEQDSLTPVPVDSTSFDEELAGLHQGQARQAWKWLGVVIAFGLLAVLTIRGMESAHLRDEAWAGYTYLTQAKLNSFMNCALPRAQPIRITSRDQFHSLLERHMQANVAAYGRKLDACLPELREFKTGLANMTVPEEVTAEHAAMVGAAEVMYEQAHTLADALESEPELDFVRSTGLIDRLTGAHAQFRTSAQQWSTAMAF